MNRSVFSKFMSKQEMEEKDIKKNVNILKAFTEEELDDYKIVNGNALNEITSISNCTIKDIQAMIIQYETFCNIHLWLHKVQDSGNPIPKSQEELYERFRANPEFIKTKAKKRNRNIKLSRKQREEYIKYGERAIKY